MLTQLLTMTTTHKFPSQCDKSFPRKDTLTKHQRTVHSDIRYPCDRCDFSATTTSNLNRHKRSKHGGVGGGGVKAEVETTVFQIG